MQLQDLNDEISHDLQAINQKIARFETLLKSHSVLQIEGDPRVRVQCIREFDRKLAVHGLRYFQRLFTSMKLFLNLDSFSSDFLGYIDRLQGFVGNMKSLSVFKFNTCFFDTLDDVTTYEIHVQGCQCILSNLVNAMRINRSVPPNLSVFKQSVFNYFEVILSSLEKILIITQANLTI